VVLLNDFGGFFLNKLCDLLKDTDHLIQFIKKVSKLGPFKAKSPKNKIGYCKNGATKRPLALFYFLHFLLSLFKVGIYLKSSCLRIC